MSLVPARIGLCLVFLLLAPRIYAVRNLTITGDKSSLLGTEELTISASASGFTDGETIYIKGAFSQMSSINYFGYTQSGDSWIKNSTTNTSQRAITIGSWDGKLKVKSDFDDSGFTGEGDYNVKVAFYYLTGSGNLSSINWSANALTVNLNAPDPTPTATPTPANTPTPTPGPTATPRPSPTAIAGAATPIRMPTPTTIIISSDTAILVEDVQFSTEPAVLGASESAAPRPKTPIIISLLLVGTGTGLLSLVSLWQKRNAILK